MDKVNIVDEKQKDKRNRPPRSEIIFNFVDEWEYAHDVTYFNLSRDFDTAKVAASLDFADINNIEQEKSNNAIENKNNGFKPILESGGGNVFNALSDFYGSLISATSYFYGVTNSLTSAQVFRSVFWRLQQPQTSWCKIIFGKLH